MVFKKGIKYLLIIGACILLKACTEAPKEEPVAQVGDRFLYKSDLLKIFPGNATKEDSLIIATDYINKWVKQELMIQKANENLSQSQKDVSRELEEYRNSLIIFRYKNELMQQRMDTVVSEDQIQQYYDQNKAAFNLDRYIVKGVYVKIPKELANINALKTMVQDMTDEGQSVLKDYCTRYAKNFEIANNWIDFKVLNRSLPVSIDDPEAFLRNNSLKEMTDEDYYYLVSIRDYKLTNDLAPLEFVENDIKNLILNQRKIKFLREVENNIYKEGERKKKFKIYDTAINNE
ncbi:hypothetical protein [Maribellus sp. YY47]|uniref:hypothetical protein n=1 Tax=Maribellus sp. YY47 TaxID=2929486 RepID=UPI002001B7C3|nr:hypothetical protein [Maribellus sp. YY47]MCK3684086.1 hypothetical protein [Maribellus sp. YY47]